MMKKTIAIVCCLLWTAAFAQNIPADSLDTYRKEAHRMLIAGDTSGAVDFYKQLALSGDALSGYQLYELYSEGKGVPKDEHEAAKWQELAQHNLAAKAKRAQAKAAKEEEVRKYGEKGPTLEDLFHESGALIERGAKEKLASIIVIGAGGAAGGTLLGVGLATRDADSGLGIAIAGSAIMYACGVAAVVLNILGNVHIKQGGELMRRVQIKGNGISVSF